MTDARLQACGIYTEAQRTNEHCGVGYDFRPDAFDPRRRPLSIIRETARLVMVAMCAAIIGFALVGAHTLLSLGGLT